MNATLSRLLVVCLLTAPAMAADEATAGADGRYEGISATANAVWVVDTRTGRVRKCTQEFADQMPVCSKMSN